MSELRPGTTPSVPSGKPRMGQTWPPTPSTGQREKQGCRKGQAWLRVTPYVYGRGETKGWVSWPTVRTGSPALHPAICGPDRGAAPPRSTVREVKGREVCGPSEERRAKGRDRRGWEASQAPDFTPEAPDGWQGCHHSPPLPGLQRAAWQYFLSLGETQCRGQRSRCSHKIQPSCPLCLNRTVKKATHSTPGPTVLKSTHF